MLITFIPTHGTPRTAVEYCKASRGSDGLVRHVTRLRGDEELFVAVTSPLNFRQAYQSCVIGWAPGDVPTPAVLDQLLDGLAVLCFAGLHPSRFCCVAFKHQRGDKVDVHILIACVDLETGLHFNPARPGWRRAFAPLCDHYNYTHGWARPNDPRRTPLVAPGRQPFYGPARRRAGLPMHTLQRTLLHKHVLRVLVKGQLQTQADLIECLEKCTTIISVGPKSITVELSSAPHRLRLRGALFSADFDFKAWKNFRRRRRTLADQEADRDEVKARNAKEKLKQAVDARAAINMERYGRRGGRVMLPGDPFKDEVIPTALTMAEALKMDPAAPILTYRSSLEFKHGHSDRPTLAVRAGAVGRRIQEGFQQLVDATARFAEHLREALRSTEQQNRLDPRSPRSPRARSIRRIGRP